MAALKKIEIVGLPFSMVTVDSFTQDDISDQKGFDSLLTSGETRSSETVARTKPKESRDELEMSDLKVTALPFSMVTVGSFRQKNVHGQKGFDRMLVASDPMGDYVNAYLRLCGDVSKAYVAAWASLCTGFALPSGAKRTA